MTADPDYSSPTPPGPAPQLPDVALASASWQLVNELLGRMHAAEQRATQAEKALAAMRDQSAQVWMAQADATQQLADRLAVLEIRTERIEQDTAGGRG